MSVSDPHRILLVTKPRYIGDTVVATPAFRAIAARYPKADINLLTGVPGGEAMRGCPFLQQIRVIERSKRRQIVEVFRLAGTLRDHDLAVIFDRSLRSALTCWLARIPKRVGFAAEFRGPLLTTRVPQDRSMLEIDCLLEISSAVGAPPVDRETMLWVGDDERQEARQQFSLEGRSIVTMAPAANDPEIRQWPASHFIHVGRTLAGQGHLPVLIGAPSEVDAARPVFEGLSGCALNLTGLTSVREALSLIALSSLFLSADIGLAHCAVALKTPSVTVYGPTKIARWGQDTAINRALWVVAKSDRPTNAEIRSCIDAVTPDMVLEAAEQVTCIGVRRDE